MFKYIILFLPFIVLASEIKFSWEKEQFSVAVDMKSKDPINSIQSEIIKLVNNYLKPRSIINVDNAIPKEVIKPILPPKVIKPKVIKKVKLVQGKYEPKRDFKARVELENQRYIEKSKKQKNAYLKKVDERNSKIKMLSARYKLDVRLRNEKIKALQAEVDEDIKNIKKEQEKKIAKLEGLLPIFVKNAFKKYLADPYVKSSDYFVNSETMQITLASTINNFSEKLEFHVEPQVAQHMDRDLSQLLPKIHYSVDIDTKTNQLKMKVKQIELLFKDDIYVAKNASTQLSKNFATASLEIDDPTNVSIADQKLDLQVDDLKLALQKSDIKPVTYRITSESTNEIIKRLQGLKASKKDDKKWLFVVGIEKYDNDVASIAYSKQSAQSFATVSQKLLGVPKENSFILTDSKTSSGSIKSKLKLMLDLVKKGDTIYFYYSGHGIPVAKESNEPYILPKDIDPNYINDEAFFKLKNIYSTLSKSKASKIIAVVDSCFSGATDGEALIKGVAAARLKPKSVDAFDKTKMVVLSAGRNKQYSNMYAKKEQRLFSYFIMDALLKNNKSVDALYKEVEYWVSKESRKMGNLKLQQPTLSGNSKLKF